VKRVQANWLEKKKGRRVEPGVRPLYPGEPRIIGLKKTVRLKKGARLGEGGRKIDHAEPTVKKR